MAILFRVGGTEFDRSGGDDVRCSLCCLQNLAVGSLASVVFVGGCIFLVEQRSGSDLERSFGLCPASGQDQLHLRRGQTATSAVVLFLTLCYPER